MACQLTLAAERRYQCPLSVTDRRELFALWCERNPTLLALIEAKAVRLASAGHKRISTKYLVEWARYELYVEAVPVPFEDEHGRTHTYSINNSDTAALARWLLERHPDMPIDRRRSVLDEVAA